MNKLIMMDQKIKTVGDLEKFLEASQDLDFRQTDRKTTYAWVDELLKRFNYHAESKKRKGILKRYVVKLTCYSDRQVKRLIKEHNWFGKLRVKKSCYRNRFSKTYTSSRANQAIFASIASIRAILASKKVFIISMPLMRSINGRW